MSEMVERATAAIRTHEMFYQIMEDSGTDSRTGDEIANNLARAVIKSMREPSDAMCDAAYEAALDENARGVWHEMIDAALSGEEAR